MTADFNQNQHEPGSDDFQSFLSALSGPQQQPPPPQASYGYGQQQYGSGALENPPGQASGQRRMVPPTMGMSQRKGPGEPDIPQPRGSGFLPGGMEKFPPVPQEPGVGFMPREGGVAGPPPQEPASRAQMPPRLNRGQTTSDSMKFKGTETRSLQEGQEHPTRPAETPIALTHMSVRPQFTLEQLFETMIRERASDLHIASGCVPALRLNGEIVPMELPALDRDAAKNLILPILNEQQRQILEDEGEVDFSFDYFGKARFRVNYFHHHWGIGGVYRFIPMQVPRLHHLGLPKVIKDLLKYKKGLILIAGPSSSGKSTTIASMLEEVNQTQPKRIITMEKPVEYLIRSQNSLISQREIGTSAANYNDALWAVLREDPDIIMIGELWEAEDIKHVLKIAETGHLVIASINTIDCTKAVERLINAFPQDEHNQIRIMISEAIVGIVAQRLIPRADGRGRILATEVLVGTPGLASLIREGKISQVASVIQTGGELGMKTMDQSLIELLEKKAVSSQAIRALITDERFFKRAGIDF